MTNLSTPSTFLSRAKFVLIALVKKNPILWSISWKIAAHLDFLLPHDKSYYGFVHFGIPNGVFLDIGANNGITALGIHKVLPDYSIISIEADPSHRPALERVKRRLGKFQYKVIAASDVEAELVLYTPSVNGRSIHTLTSSDLEYLKVSVARDFGVSKAHAVTYDRHVVKSLPLDQLEISPDLIKIDVEGYELPALKGLSNTIDRQRPIIMVEFTPGFFDKTAQYLDAKGYEFFLYDDDKKVFHHLNYDRADQIWSHGALQVNLFGVPKEKVGRIAHLIVGSQA